MYMHLSEQLPHIIPGYKKVKRQTLKLRGSDEETQETTVSLLQEEQCFMDLD